MQAAHNIASQAHDKMNIAQQLAMAARHPETAEVAAISMKLTTQPCDNVEGRRGSMFISSPSTLAEVATPSMI